MPSAWQAEADNNKLHAILACIQAPAIGAYQVCQLHLSTTAGDPVAAKIYVNGGMPGHSHGLPTTPLVVPIEPSGSYEIRGLRFGMPGQWLLDFAIHGDKDVDHIIVKFEVGF